MFHPLKRIEICLLFLKLIQDISSADIREPPRIFEEWKDEDFYQINTDHTFKCNASGSGDIKYSLFKNNIVIFADQPQTDFLMPSLQPRSQGTYHCTASNKHGVSKSKMMPFKMATQVLFDKAGKKLSVETASSSLQIECKPEIMPIIPVGEYAWFHESLGDDEIVNAKDKQTDDDGTIHISNVIRHRQANKAFYCKATNGFLKQWAQSGMSTLEIKDIASTPNFPPVIMTASSLSANQFLAFEGEPVTLRCLFSGYPTPEITWYDEADQSNELKSDWLRLFENTHVTYKERASSSVTGSYVCKGTNSIGESSHVIQVKVESKPRFVSDKDKLKDVVASEGDDVTMRCLSRSDPIADIKWFKNGVALNEQTTPPNYVLSADKSELLVRGVCKLCDQPDLGVIQYQATNKHGNLYSEASLNVLERTKIDVGLSKLDDVNWTANENVQFKMVATSDPSTTINYQWYRNDEKIVNGTDQRLMWDNNGSLSILMDGEDDGGLHRCGAYKCLVSNDYSTDQKVVKLIDPNAPWVFPWWLILIIVLLLLLLLLLLLCLLLWCCGCCRKQGEDYHVDKNERSRGKDPVRELNASGFKDYQNISITNNESNNIIDVKDSSLSYNNDNSLKRNGDNYSLTGVKGNKSSLKNKKNIRDNNLNNNMFNNEADNSVNNIDYGDTNNAEFININNLNSSVKSKSKVYTISNEYEGNADNYDYDGRNVCTNQDRTGSKGFERNGGVGSNVRKYGYTTETLPDLRNESLYGGQAARRHKTNTLPGPGQMEYEDDFEGGFADHEETFQNYSYHVNQAYDDDANVNIGVNKNRSVNNGINANSTAYVEQRYSSGQERSNYANV